MKIKTTRATCDYLTNGKEYEVREVQQGIFISGYITDDSGEEIEVIVERCMHINGHSWEVIYE